MQPGATCIPITTSFGPAAARGECLRAKRPCLRAWFIGVWATAVATCISAAQTNVAPQVEVTVTAKSVFVDDLKFGKDPFFPKSVRRTFVAPVETASPQNDVADGRFSLKGISIVGGRRLALINNYTLAVGEEADIKVDGHLVRVRCVQISERAAIINVRGTTIPLSLRPGL